MSMKEFQELTGRLQDAAVLLKEAAEMFEVNNAMTDKSVIGVSFGWDYTTRTFDVLVQLYEPLVDSVRMYFDKTQDQMVRVVQGVKFFSIVDKEEGVE